jgi:hypothetical protein
MENLSAVQFLENYFGVIDENRKKIFEEAHKMEDETISKLKERIDDLENQILEMGERN